MNMGIISIDRVCELLRMLGIGCVLMTLLVCSRALAQDQHLTRTTVADRQVTILGYARSNPACEGVDPPSLYVDNPPEHGNLCYRESKVKLQEAIVGNLTHCVGRQIPGIVVIYVPQSGYTGPDSMRYTVIFPQARHVVFVDVMVTPGEVKSRNAASGAIDVLPETAHAQRSIRACTELVS